MKLSLILGLCLLLSACATQYELPTNDGESSDKMKPSPCACKEVPFNDGGFTWRS